MYALKHPPLSLLFRYFSSTMLGMFSIRWESLQFECYAHIWGSKIALRNKSESLDIQTGKAFSFSASTRAIEHCVAFRISGSGKKLKIAIKECRWNSNADSYGIWIRRNLQLLLRTQNCHTSSEHWPTLLERLFVCVTKKISCDFWNRWLRSWFGV